MELNEIVTHVEAFCKITLHTCNLFKWLFLMFITKDIAFVVQNALSMMG